jgi:hypothetical protein
MYSLQGGPAGYGPREELRLQLSSKAAWLETQERAKGHLLQNSFLFRVG